MARKIRSLVIVFVDDKGALHAKAHGEDETGARTELAGLVQKGLKAKLFDGAELPFEQGIIIGRREEAPKRTRKRKAKPEEAVVPSNGTTFTPVIASTPA
jgi:hypothetical protein